MKFRKRETCERFAHTLGYRKEVDRKGRQSWACTICGAQRQILDDDDGTYVLMDAHHLFKMHTGNRHHMEAMRAAIGAIDSLGLQLQRFRYAMFKDVGDQPELHAQLVELLALVLEEDFPEAADELRSRPVPVGRMRERA